MNPINKLEQPMTARPTISVDRDPGENIGHSANNNAYPESHTAGYHQHHAHHSIADYLSPLATRNSSASSVASSAATNDQIHITTSHDESLALSNDLEDKLLSSSTELPERRRTTTLATFANGMISVPNDEKDTLRTYIPSKVKETKHVSVEYDPISRRKVLNTYEVLKDLGHGQHGKVKLGRDMISKTLVAIKIVDRKSKPRLGKQLQRGGTQEEKIRKEIAIMKKCDHPHVVKLIEVLDDVTSRKIYLILEYLERGEIKWQTIDEFTQESKPLLQFHEIQKIFRDVVSGLEYLHYQGIIHRDIKPANLLVSGTGVVKISDFGVSFASSLNYSNNEYELCKTAGTPAFLAPELCRTEVIAGENNNDITVDHKIDIWALGVTLFCLLFGRLPFNSESEFKLFEVINTEELQIPSKDNLVDGDQVSDDEYEATIDLLQKLLRKNSQQRIDIPEIKQHDFFLHGLSQAEFNEYFTGNDAIKLYVSNEEMHRAVVGIGSKIKKKLANAFKLGSFSHSPDGSQLSLPTSPLDSSASSSSKPSMTKLPNNSNRSLILSEQLSPVLSTASATEASSPRSPPAMRAVEALQEMYSDRRGSADLIETKDFAEGSFKRAHNNAALEHIMKLNSHGNSGRDTPVDHRDSIESNSYLTEDRNIRQNSTSDTNDRDEDLGKFLEKQKQSRLKTNSSFASLDSLADDSNVIVDVSAYDSVGAHRGHSSNPIKFNDVNYSAKKSNRRDSTNSNSEFTPTRYQPNQSSNASLTNYGRRRRRSSSRHSCSSTSSSMTGDMSRSTSASRSVTNPDHLSGLSRASTASSRRRATFFSFDNGSSDEDDDSQEHLTNKIGSSIGAQSNDDDDDEDDDDEDDDHELTLEFGPKADVPFLRNRVMSHESNIPARMRPASMNNLSSAYYEDSDYVMPSAAVGALDLPEEFQTFIPELKPQSVTSSSHGIQTVPRIASATVKSSSPLRSSVMAPTSSLETIKVDHGHPHRPHFLQAPASAQSNAARASSPLVKDAPASSKATIASHLFQDVHQTNFDKFKNHYSKDHNVIPFQHSHHLGHGNGDGNSTTKTSTALRTRQQYADAGRLHRHNSVTIGLLPGKKPLD